jgi:hypothetical protein
MARSSRVPAARARLLLDPASRESRPTDKVSLRQCCGVGVTAALPGGYKDRGVPADKPEDDLCCLAGSVPRRRRISSVTPTSNSVDLSKRNQFDGGSSSDQRLMGLNHLVIPAYKTLHRLMPGMATRVDKSGLAHLLAGLWVLDQA